VVTGNKVWCWGNNERAQLARPDDQGSYVLGPAEATTDPLAMSKVVFGSWTVLGLTADGAVATWGDVAGRDGLLGGRMTSITPDPAPNPLVTLENVTSLVASVTTDRPGSGGGFPPRPPIKLAHACALAAGTVYCWGRSDVGALGTGLSDDELVPALSPIAGKAWPQQLAAGVELTCARMTDGSIQCAGSDEKGRLGTGQTEPFSLFFKPVASFKSHAVQVATSDLAVCALVKDGSVECWGSNSHRELATEFGDEDPHPSPVKITF
jgi:alpha-tubulin suppressor-like RCC1 family protein